MSKKSVIIGPDGKEYKSITALAKAYGCNYDIVRQRLKRGISVEDALSKERISREHTGKKIIGPDGKEYDGIKSLSEAYECNYNTVRYRLKQGMSLKDALSKEKILSGHPGKKIVGPDGKEYRSVRSLAKAYGCNYATVQQRLKKGMSLEDSLNKEKIPWRHTGKKMIGPDGKEYKSITDLVEKYGCNYNTVFSRIKRGLALEDVLSKERLLEHSGKKIIGPDGKEYKSITALAKAYGCNYDIVRRRLKKGFSVEDAISKSKFANKREVEKFVGPDGKEFKSLRALTKAYEYNYDTVRRRLKKGISLEDALSKERISRKPTDKKFIAPDGKEYGSIKALAKAYGCNYDTVQRRLKKGFSVEDAISKSKLLNANKKIVGPDGKEYDSIKSLSKAYECNYNIVRYRLKQGMSLEDALSKEKIPSGCPGKKIIGPDGKEYKSIKALAKAYGCNYDIVRVRLKKGYSLEEALFKEKSPGRYRKKIAGPDGKEYKSIKALAEKYGCNYGTITSRLERGMSLKDALSKEKIPSGCSGKKIVGPDGKEYKSIKALAEAYGCKYYIVKYRLNKGYPIEKALSKEQLPFRHTENQ